MNAASSHQKPSTTHFKRSARHTCTDLDALFAAGRFSELVELLQPVLKSAIRRYSLTPEDREDALSMATVHLLTEFKAGKTYRGGSIRAVAIVRARSIVLDMYAYARRAEAHDLKVVPLDTAVGREEDSEYTIDVIDQRADATAPVMQASLVTAALHGLTPRERQAAVKRCLEDKTAEQTGTEMNCKPNAVDQVLFRAKKKMRRNLLDYYGDAAA